MIITGATGGLGRAASGYFADEAKRLGCVLMLCCRNRVKGDELISFLRSEGKDVSHVEIRILDLSDTASLSEFAGGMVSSGYKVRMLLNNAGSMFAGYETDENGVEKNMRVNFLAPASLSLALMPYYSDGASVINVVSVTRNWVEIDGGYMQGKEGEYGRLKYYSRSKRALSIFTAEMAERSVREKSGNGRSLYVNAVDPGVMNTSMLRMERWFDPLADIFFRPFTLSPEQSLEAVVSAYENVGKVSGYVFTRRKSFPMEKKIREHWLKNDIFASACTEAENLENNYYNYRG